MPGRREFLIGSTAGLTAMFLKWPSLSAQLTTSRLADSHLDILLSEPLGTISSDIYGHFSENLGGVIYDGVWVGDDSKVPNQHGIRSALIEQLRKIKAPVIRWPGGCFADSYDWRDGVGPRDKRPRRTNFWSGSPQSPAIHKYDPNQFGTDDFVRFCRLTGAEPYLAANLRSLSALEFDRWVEYCNSPEGSTTLADLRKAGGSPQPFNVRYWGAGNESWGCGGEFTAQEYAVEFRRYSTWLPRYGQQLQLITSGPNDNDWTWTRAFLEEITRKHPAHLSKIYGLALHHYAWDLSRGIPQVGTTGNDDRDGKPATFWGLQGSASLANKKLVLTVVNPHVSEPRLTEIAIRGATGKSGTVTTLTSPDIHARNTFDQPNTLIPKTDTIHLKGSTLVYEFPPASVSALQIELV